MYFYKAHYAEKVIPAFEKLKFNYFGHDSVVLHENEIRKQKGSFAFLSHLPTRRIFLDRLSEIVNASRFVLTACLVDKNRLSRSEGVSSKPYHIALAACLQSLHEFLEEKSQNHLKTHVIVECRGKREDTALELEFRRICNRNNLPGEHSPFEIVFADKKTYLFGLQLADLAARPVGINYLRPEQQNQAFEVLKPKFFCAGGRRFVGTGYEDKGLKVYPPQKAKSPGEPTEAATPTRNPQST